jgi:phosphoribosylglycinamide formyltransferase-1
LNAVKQALDYGVKITGCTVHCVNERIDQGKIIAQKAVPVLEEDTLESLLLRVHQAEHLLYPQVIRAIANGNYFGE